jgi:hypothetical protein
MITQFGAVFMQLAWDFPQHLRSSKIIKVRKKILKGSRGHGDNQSICVRNAAERMQ